MNPLVKYPWITRLVAGAVGAALLAAQAGRIDLFGAVLIYAASWIILLHVMVGEYVLVQHLHANSKNQRALDTLAFIVFLGGILSFTSAPLWCAFMAGIFALAIVKYVLVEQQTPQPALRQYAREKIRWEAPSVLLFAALAVFMDMRTPREGKLPVAELAILGASTPSLPSGWWRCGQFMLRLHDWRSTGMREDWLNKLWSEVRQEIPQRWNRLTVLDLEIVQGKMKNLVAAVCNRHGRDRCAAQYAVDEWSRCHFAVKQATRENS